MFFVYVNSFNYNYPLAYTNVGEIGQIEGSGVIEREGRCN